jgi:radical SAM superfamily enzyme YgiQ (UPF0313 family)
MIKKSVYLFQPQDVINSGDEENYWLPYSAACLWSYVMQFPDISDYYELRNIFFKREPHDYVLENLDNPSVVGFSCYVWNENYCLTLAKKIKTKWPDCKIIFGGEQTSDRYKKYNFIDISVIAEGEQSFLKILRSLINNTELADLSDVMRSPRLDNLDIPSPYLDGTMDMIVKQYPDLTWATVIESNRGCPYSCTFCDWGGALQAKIKKFSLERVQAELEWVKNNKVAYIVFADANFGIFKERDKTIAKMIKHIGNNGVLEAVNLQYAKNNVDAVFEIGKILGHFNRGITVSVQSMNPDTLTAIKRKNLKINDIEKIMKLSKEYDVDTYTDVILGLPLETEESWKEGLTQLLELGQHQSIDFGLAEILENSELNQSSYLERYKIKTKDLSQYYTLSEDNCPESGKVICETSTMTLDELVNSYMYAWMISYCHISGYTILYSKYARYMHGVSYRTFYDKLFNRLHTTETISDHFKSVKSNFKKYLQTGKLNGWGEKGDTFHFASHEFCYNNKDSIFKAGKEVIIELGLEYDEIFKLQNLLICNIDDLRNNKLYSLVDSNLDIVEWKNKKCKYRVVNKFNQIKDKEMPLGIVKNYERLNFWFMRRKNLLKNILEKV